MKTIGGYAFNTEAGAVIEMRSKIAEPARDMVADIDYQHKIERGHNRVTHTYTLLTPAARATDPMAWVYKADSFPFGGCYTVVEGDLLDPTVIRVEVYID